MKGILVASGVFLAGLLQGSGDATAQRARGLWGGASILQPGMTTGSIGVRAGGGSRAVIVVRPNAIGFGPRAYGMRAPVYNGRIYGTYGPRPRGYPGRIWRYPNETNELAASLAVRPPTYPFYEGFPYGSAVGPWSDGLIPPGICRWIRRQVIASNGQLVIRRVQVCTY